MCDLSQKSIWLRIIHIKKKKKKASKKFKIRKLHSPDPDKELRNLGPAAQLLVTQGSWQVISILEFRLELPGVNFRGFN